MPELRGAKDENLSNDVCYQQSPLEAHHLPRTADTQIHSVTQTFYLQTLFPLMDYHYPLNGYYNPYQFPLAYENNLQLHHQRYYNQETQIPPPQQQEEAPIQQLPRHWNFNFMVQQVTLLMENTVTLSHYVSQGLHSNMRMQHAHQLLQVQEIIALDLNN